MWSTPVTTTLFILLLESMYIHCFLWNFKALKSSSTKEKKKKKKLASLLTSVRNSVVIVEPLKGSPKPGVKIHKYNLKRNLEAQYLRRHTAPLSWYFLWCWSQTQHFWGFRNNALLFMSCLRHVEYLCVTDSADQTLQRNYELKTSKPNSALTL